MIEDLENGLTVRGKLNTALTALGIGTIANGEDQDVLTAKLNAALDIFLIDPITDDELGSSIRTKLNSLLTLAAGTAWYVRPAGGTYGSENGTSYANAFDGFQDIVWASIQPGDRIYIAGKHSGTPGLVVGASGTSGVPVSLLSCETALGASTDDPGTIWGGRLFLSTVWGAPVSGAYPFTTGATATANFVIDEDLTVLSHAASLAACQATEQSWYRDGGAGVMYYHPGPGGLKNLHWSITCPLNINAKSYINVKGLNLYQEDSTTGCIRVFKFGTDTISPVGIKVDDCTIAFGKLYGIRTAGATDLTITNCTFFDSCAAIYHTNNQGTKLHVIGCEFYHTSNILSPLFAAAPGDEGAVAVQGGMTELVVTDNYIHDWHAEGIYPYLGTTVGETYAGAQILRNRVFLDSSEVNVKQLMCISLGGDNAANLAEGWAGTVIANNVLSGGHASTISGGSFNGAIRLKCNTPADPANRVKVYNNTAYDCCNLIYGRATGTGSLGFIAKNNISSTPESGQYHIYIENQPSLASIELDYNLYHGTGQFKWGSASADANLAAWKVTSSQDANSFTTDPALDVDYRISAGSSAQDSGTNTALTDDADGNPRPVGAYDIGAYEVQ